MKDLDVDLAITKINDDNFVGVISFGSRYEILYGTDYIQVFDEARKVLLKFLEEED